MWGTKGPFKPPPLLLDCAQRSPELFVMNAIRALDSNDNVMKVSPRVFCATHPWTVHTSMFHQSAQGTIAAAHRFCPSPISVSLFFGDFFGSKRSMSSQVVFG